MSKEEMVHDVLNERVVIESAIADETKRRILVRTISSEEMLFPDHAAIWRAFRVMVDRNLSYDSETMQRLVRDEKADFDGKYLMGLEQDAAVSDNLDWHVRTLRWDATRLRTLKGPTTELLTLLKDSRSTPESVESAARALVRAVAGGHGRKHMRRPEELQRSYKADIAARRAVGNFYPMGYPAIDAKLVEGTMPGKTCVVAGLPGSGKSTWASSDLPIKLAFAKRRPLVCAWEMGTESLIDVMVSSMTKIELKRIVQGNLTSEEESRIGRVVDWITSHIKFMDNAFFDMDTRKIMNAKSKFGATNDEPMDLLEGYIAESGCDVVIMDLWERMLADISYGGVTKALYRQQQMAKTYNFYSVIVHQLLLKDVEKRVDKRPTRDSIKGTGAFVEVADQIFGVHRDAQFKRVPDDSFEIINMKQRKGPPNWAVRFKWDAERSSITGGEEVSYDPGLESAEALGDISDMSDIKTNRKRGRNG